MKGTATTNTLNKYEQIAKAIGLTDKEFDEILKEARKRAYIEEVGEDEYEDMNIEYALKSKFGDNPEALRGGWKCHQLPCKQIPQWLALILIKRWQTTTSKSNAIVLRYSRGWRPKIEHQKYIIIWRKKCIRQERFIVAHELAHHLDDTIWYVCMFMAERRADKMAREMLIPEDTLRLLVSEWYDEYSALASIFGVEESVVEARCKEVFNF